MLTAQQCTFLQNSRFATNGRRSINHNSKSIKGPTLNFSPYLHWLMLITQKTYQTNRLICIDRDLCISNSIAQRIPAIGNKEFVLFVPNRSLNYEHFDKSFISLSAIEAEIQQFDPRRLARFRANRSNFSDLYSGHRLTQKSNILVFNIFHTDESLCQMASKSVTVMSDFILNRVDLIRNDP